jgi:acyl-CoA synthetase (AMP-forming)/AMP-acid ligase II
LATLTGSRPVLLAEDGREWPAAALFATVVALARQLSGVGVMRQDRVALVTANGPAAAFAFLAAATVCIAAPLNPAYTESEFRFALSDLPARLLVTDGTAPAASKAARSLGIPQLTITPSMTLDGVGEADFPDADQSDLALVLHTSGTTGRPKRVPLTHANLATSAANIAESLSLTPDDRCLNVMPLFHIHGLVGCLLASLFAGSSIASSPGFDAFRFSGWLADFQPTWYSAVPTMHQAIGARARGGLELHHNLRFARSASSSLSPIVGAAIEGLFGVPVVEAYGMTEASHQVASNPLPPGERRFGSVGRPIGVEVAIFGSDGEPLPMNERGEVAIKGPAVTSGYEGVDPATTTFPGGWLRTGDEGYFDPDGYLWLTARIKELINRGGEKISPAEVETVLLSHPSVAQAVVFAIEHASLGQDVAAVVVLREGAEPVDESALRAFVAESMARFKVPRRIVFRDSVPLGPTGKPQRTTMAERLGLA